MNLTSLNLGAPTKPPKVPAKDDRCPTCRAPKDRRVNTGGFGAVSVVVCEACGHEFKEN